MKKFLLTCFLALGIGASAQYNFTGDFETPGYNTTTYKQFGGGSQFAAAACNGANGGRLLPTANITSTGFMVDLSTISQTGNGQKIDFSASYKKASGVTGTLQLAYFTYNAGSANWTINVVGAPVTLTNAALTTCSTLSATLPAGLVQPGAIVGVGVWFVRSGTANAGIYVDDIIVTQDTSVTTAPACTTVTNPQSGSTISAGNLTMTWNAVPTAVNYKVTVGTTPNGTDLFSGVVAGTSLNVGLAKSTTYYAKVSPANGNGEASGCTEITFTTNNNIGYCAVGGTPVFAISSVSLNGTTKTSPATGAPVYEDFTSTVFNVKSGSTYNLDVIATGAGANIFALTVFVDWNEDGDFDDANERYFQGSPLITGSGNPTNLTGAIAVPAGTTVGTKRMRVKYNFNAGSATVLAAPLVDPCASMANGQAEDYSVSVTLLTDAPLCAAITAPANNATGVATNATMTWAAAVEAAGYKLYLGTSSGATDILNGTVVTGTSYSLNLTPFTTYFAKLVPYNAIGDATGCTEISFTTGSVSYCTPTPAYSYVEPTTNVTFAGIDNTSSAAVGTTPAYEQFLDKIAQVRIGEGPYTISMNANTDGAAYRHFFAVFIDWNQDGDFDDAGEQYFTTEPDFKFVLGSDGTGTPVTGDITIPADAKLGQTRMRVKSAFYSATGPSAGTNLTEFANGCSTLGSSFGQVEDYTVNVEISQATTNVVDKNKVSVYPNPFQDVLKISDVKGVKSISVSDVSGRQVKNMKPAAELNLSDLKTGMYIVTLNMEDGTVKSFKTIKK